jgi:hypothetical protein
MIECVTPQDASGLAFGERRQTQAPRLAQDVRRLVDRGARVFYVREDRAARGIERGEVIAGVHPIGRTTLRELFETYDQVWHW